ncbi:Methyl-CpG-binding domain-containing protein 9 [Acorus gramineus]|uniref:Methyl-CpG-binding domain-containing protein 9 n=1 Tax=Acorus gramineus TaxID=55184 RepID=A0AAV9AGV3_ACOGR|nr:Methyl-CpG-binding domain-containing protein 9 [Acorus gramineus]
MSGGGGGGASPSAPRASVDGKGGSSDGKSSEGIRTYNRRKRSKAGADGVEQPVMAKATLNEQNEPLVCNTSYENGTVGENHHHGENVLEHILKLLDIGKGGIREYIMETLACGPSGSTSKIKKNSISLNTMQKKVCIHRHEDGVEGQRYSQNESKTSGNCFYVAEPKLVSANHPDPSEEGPHEHTIMNDSTKKFQSAFLDVIMSEKFATLCDLLCGIKHNSIIDLGIINSKIKDGTYESSPEILAVDVQQVWKRFQDIGLLANNLSDISHASLCKQMGDLVNGTSERNLCEGIYADGSKPKNSSDSCVQEGLPSAGTDQSTKPFKVRTCKRCMDPLEQNSLICDGCESTFHLSCVDPPLDAAPTKSWFCTDCYAHKKAFLSENESENPHLNCVVCNRLKYSKMKKLPANVQEAATNGDMREDSVSSLEPDSHLCKYCKEPEESDKRFIKCGHPQCQYKYYHIRCLKSPQAVVRPGKHCWYCPSCLCRSCLLDKDDSKIVLCDGCDEGYHIYCMTPPRVSIPKGNWYCFDCNMKRMKEGELDVSEPSMPSLRQCSHCGEYDEAKEFMMCGHEQCPCKYYHVKCLTIAQTMKQSALRCWYCPSCLCRACLLDKDDDKIVLCDGCDDAYHIYCMKPPLASIPEGSWYCFKCNVKRIREGMKRYESSVLRQVKKLKSEEVVVTAGRKKQAKS